MECPECGTQVAVRKDGTLYNHKDDEGTCPGSGEPGGVSGTVGLGKGDSFEDVEDAPEVAVPAPAPAGGFEWRCTVKAPCLYLDDAAWHLANGRAAEAAARAAGHTVSGEAELVDTAPSADGRTVVLVYRVRV